MAWGRPPTTLKAPSVPGAENLVLIGFICILAKIQDKMAHFLGVTTSYALSIFSLNFMKSKKPLFTAIPETVGW